MDVVGADRELVTCVRVTKQEFGVECVGNDCGVNRGGVLVNRSNTKLPWCSSDKRCSGQPMEACKSNSRGSILVSVCCGYLMFYLLCTFRRVLETAVSDGKEKLRLQKEVTETRGVDTNVRSLLDFLGGDLGLGVDGGVEGVVLLVIDEIIVVFLLKHNFSLNFRHDYVCI